MDFFPKNPKFFDLFEELAGKAETAGKILSNIKVSHNNIISLAKKTRELENEADEICHSLYRQADSTFITPIDREDIHALARTLDNIIDLIENLTSNLVLYRIKKQEYQFNKFTHVIGQATNKIFTLIELLKHKGKYIGQMRALIIEIHSLENEGDSLIRLSFQKLFTRRNPLHVIKWKDLIENLEEILDECEDTADIVDEIIVKNF